MACIPDESVFTVAEYKAMAREMLMTGDIREIQYSDKRTVFKGVSDAKEILLMVENFIWGHCRGKCKSTFIATSKGIC